MKRFLFCWELGMNLGHLARLLPIAQSLKEQGHAVLVAARDLQAAATVLGPAGISFVQAPHLPQGIPLPHRPTGYADILLSQGWGSQETLWGLVHGWINLFRMFRPDKILMDYSPTARLASRMANIPTVLVGNGFELPPATNPLPVFPGFSWASQDKASGSEKIALANAKAVAKSYKQPGLEALSDLLRGDAVFYASFPELDHYGTRDGVEYIGPLLPKLRIARVPWPEGDRKIFASLRPNTPHVDAILVALKLSGAAVVCFAPGFPMAKLAEHRWPAIRYVTRLIDLDELAKEADLCVSYGAEGTINAFLMAGVPQLLSPWQVEAFLLGRAIERAGVGCALFTAQSAETICQEIIRITNDKVFRNRAAKFQEQRRNRESAARVVGTLLDDKSIPSGSNGKHSEGVTKREPLH